MTRLKIILDLAIYSTVILLVSLTIGVHWKIALPIGVLGAILVIVLSISDSQ